MSVLDKLFSLIPMEQIEQSAQKQIFDVLRLDCLKSLAVMPDVHAGGMACISLKALEIPGISLQHPMAAEGGWGVIRPRKA